MLLQINRWNVRRDVGWLDDGLEAFLLRHVHDGRLLLGLLLLFLVEEDHGRVDRPLVFLLTRSQRREDRGKHDDVVSAQRHNAQYKRSLLSGISVHYVLATFLPSLITFCDM